MGKTKPTDVQKKNSKQKEASALLSLITNVYPGLLV